MQTRVSPLSNAVRAGGLLVAAALIASAAPAQTPATAEPDETDGVVVTTDEDSQRAVLLAGAVVYGGGVDLAEVVGLTPEGLERTFNAIASSDEVQDSRTLTQLLVGNGMASPGVMPQLLMALDELSERDNRQGFVMLVTPNAVRMNVQGQSMVWKNGSPPTMAFADHELRRVMRHHPLVATHIPTGASNIGNIDDFDDWREIAHTRAQRHKYNFKVSAGTGVLKAEVTTDGEIWLAPDHRGAPIFAAFYRDFAAAVLESGWFGLMGGGLTLNFAAIAHKGLPLAGAMTQRTISRAAPIPLPAGSAFEVVLAAVLPVDDGFLDYIHGGNLPDDYELLEITSQELPDMSQPVRSMRRMYLQQLRESDTGPGRLFRRFGRRGSDNNQNSAEQNNNDSEEDDGEQEDGDDGDGG